MEYQNPYILILVDKKKIVLKISKYFINFVEGYNVDVCECDDGYNVSCIGGGFDAAR
jgi:hypothetical protein